MAAVLTSDLIVLPNDKLDAKQKLALTPKLLCFIYLFFLSHFFYFPFDA